MDGTEEQRLLFELKSEADFIFKSLEFLDGSTLNVIPFEIVECLKLALFDWLQQADYVIVTSLVNDFQHFSYDPRIAFDDQLFENLLLKYEIAFPKRLIQINLPKSLSRDYLSCVVLYHELGHFIDIKNSCSFALAKYYNQLIVDDKKFKEDTFPFLPINIIDEDSRIRVFQKHFGEYFCDLFASQYVGDSLNQYLFFLDQGSSRYSPTHPSTENRVKMVNNFLSNSGNTLCDFIKAGVEIMTGNSLVERFEQIVSDDFYNFLPLNIKNEKELHGVSNFGWQVWQNDWNPFAEKMKMETSLSSNQVYSIINNLMEKSIGNFIVTKQWKEAHSM